MRTLLILLTCALLSDASAQVGWSWQARAPLPIPTANNAVCAATVNGEERVYSFGGITTGLHRTAIHRQSFVYSTTLDEWTTIPEMPDTSGKVASAASVIGDVAYVIGGYHVLAGSPFEVSSNRVHRLDLNTDTWLTNGANIPIPIDDQVQAVWRDSLIYVITGWSNNTNVAAVQVYDPALDTWSVGTPVPNNNLYKVFGASGTIIGDTIFYYGGASLGGNLPAQDELRIGIIDPLQPTVINWLSAVSTTRPAYRSGCAEFAGKPFWVGGSAVSYNYDAVAYNGSGIVAPVAAIVRLNDSNDGLSVLPAEQAVMDIRGLGQLSGGGFHVCGGIGVNAEVLNTNWYVAPTVGIQADGQRSFHLFPNPNNGLFRVETPFDGPATFEVFDASGRVVRAGAINTPGTTMDLSGSDTGTYLLKLISGAAVTTGRFWLVN